ncbi:hypothetical protein DEO72_LG5g1168 [Vigna unguiculata]|uniref:Uncharacterized protein n=1 Tax=Vigna unguiculata TaxID=3917 RepID=A0A4D6LWN9_VIGUN|nr:hypothetical protein DEO72_LG5g1168 [Vigna unguiculata]
MGCGLERILGLLPGTRIKHVAFYGLWPAMTSFELWLRIADEHEEPLSGGSGWRVLPSWDVTNSIRIWELHLALRCVIRSMVSARALSVVADREGNESSTRCIGVHGGGHVMVMDSPYLLVVGDDRVRGTREQVMMQVEMVRLSCGEGMTMGSFC